MTGKKVRQYSTSTGSFADPSTAARLVEYCRTFFPVGATHAYRHPFAVDIQPVCAISNTISRQTNDALDVIRTRIRRQPEYHHISTLGFIDLNYLLVYHRQAYAVCVLVHKNEIAIEQGWHHRIGRNPKRFEKKRSDQQDNKDDREKSTAILDQHRLVRRPIDGCPPGPQNQHVNQPDDTGKQRGNRQNQGKIKNHVSNLCMNSGQYWLFLLHLQYCEKSFLRNFHRTDLFHSPLAGLLFFQ